MKDRTSVAGEKSGRFCRGENGEKLGGGGWGGGTLMQRVETATLFGKGESHRVTGGVWPVAPTGHIRKESERRRGGK